MTEASKLRTQAQARLNEVLADVDRNDIDEIKRRVRQACPFPERKGWPYQIWLHEVRLRVGRRRVANRAQLDLF